MTWLLTRTGAPRLEIQSREKEENPFQINHFLRKLFLFLPSASCPITLLAHACSEAPRSCKLVQSMHSPCSPSQHGLLRASTHSWLVGRRKGQPPQLPS